MGQLPVKPSLWAALSNLRQSMPWGQRLRLLLQNNWTKLRHRQSCCDNRGQPGW